MAQCYKMSLPNGRSILLLKKGGQCTLNFVRPYIEGEIPAFGKTEKIGDDVVTALNLSTEALNGLVKLCKQFNIYGYTKMSGEKCAQDAIEILRSQSDTLQEILMRKFG